MGRKFSSHSNGSSNLDKWRYTLITTVIFIIIGNPATYRITNKIFGKILGQVANPSTGCPTNVGIILHSVVFTLILRGIMGV